MASITFAAEVLADGPIGDWRLGESAGSVTAAQRRRRTSAARPGVSAIA
jgi:hypothetical protein